MKNDSGPIIDMTPQGDFARPSRHGDSTNRQVPNSLSFGAILARLAGIAILVCVAVLLFWLAVFTLPLIFFGGLILYGVYRYQIMRYGKRGSSFSKGRGRNPFIIIRR